MGPIPLRQPIYKSTKGAADWRHFGSISCRRKLRPSSIAMTLLRERKSHLCGMMVTLTHLYPVSPEHYNPIEMYQEPVSEALRPILSQQTGLYSYLRPGYGPPRPSQSYSAYILPLPNFQQVIVVVAVIKRSSRAGLVTKHGVTRSFFCFFAAIAVVLLISVCAAHYCRVPSRKFHLARPL